MSPTTKSRVNPRYRGPCLVHEEKMNWKCPHCRSIVMRNRVMKAQKPGTYSIFRQVPIYKGLHWPVVKDEQPIRES